ncbi:MAG: hypothetical protein AAGC93_23510 [Cyanobacteria bacterium P01_F01_bin.53]
MAIYSNFMNDVALLRYQQANANNEVKLIISLITYGAIEGICLSGMQAVALILAKRSKKAVRWFITQTGGMAIAMALPMLTALVFQQNINQDFQTFKILGWQMSWVVAGLLAGTMLCRARKPRIGWILINLATYLCLVIPILMLMLPFFWSPPLGDAPPLTLMGYLLIALPLMFGVLLSSYFFRDFVNQPSS